MNTRGSRYTVKPTVEVRIGQRSCAVIGEDFSNRAHRDRRLDAK